MKKQKRILKRGLLYLVLIFLGFVCVLPLYWMVRSSFMMNTQIYTTDPFIFWPEEMLWGNYIEALNFVPFTKYTMNTLFITTMCLAGTILSSTMAAYAFSRIKWKGSGICFAMILSTMMLPGAVTLIPQYIIWGKFKLINTYWPLILPSFLGGGAFNIFLLRQFFLGIPRDLDDAARIDGAGPLMIFARIILPLSKSAIIVVALFTFFNCWNDFFAPLIYLNDKEKYTLAIGLLQFRGNFGTKWNLIMAASTMVVIPCIIIYILGQKRLIEGITMTGMKA